MRLKYFISILLFCSGFASKATHIVGGGFNIVWLHDSTYELQFRMLRDCVNGRAPFDDPLQLGTFDKGTDALVQIISMSLGAVTPVEFTSVKCQGIPTGLCVEVGEYSKVITLSPGLYNNNAGYYFSWERCCRNNIIKNIVNPESAGTTFYMEIPTPKLLKNSSPKWTNNPRPLLCNGNPYSYNFEFVDPDGDSLVYSLVNPLQGNLDAQTPANMGIPRQGPYAPVTWIFGIDNNNQIPGTPPLTIDPSTGEINVTPNVTPNMLGVYVSAVRVEEYRYGIKLGEVRLELEYTVGECNTNPFPIISLADINSVNIIGNNLTVHIPDKICFDIITADIKDSLYVTINGSIFNIKESEQPVISRNDTGNLHTSTRFCWQTTCDMTGLPPQTLKVEVTDNGCPLPKTAKATYTITLVPMPLINPTRILCMSLIDNKKTIVYWGDSTGNNPYFYKYNLYRNIDHFPYAVIDTFLDKNIRMFNDDHTPDYALINYNYFMRGVNKCGFEGPPSDTMGTFDQLKYIPDQQKLITVTVENNKLIKVLWPPTWEKDFAQYFLYKSTRNDTNYKLIADFLNKYDTVYYDTDVDVKNTSYCYHLVMKDTCGNIGPNGQPSCSIVLKGISDPFEHHLSWLPYNYWENGTQCYNLFRMDTENPFNMNAIIDPTSIKYIDDRLNYESGKYHYFVESKENPSSENISSFNAMSRSNEIELIQAPLIYIPNAFTSNEDGLNDDWNVHHVFVKDYDLKVYNRWGQLMFETHDKHIHWNGETMSGEKQQTDAYVYVITYTGWDDSAHLEKGNVTLIR